MSINDFQNSLVKGYDVIQEGTNLHIKGVELFPQKVDYTDSDAVKVLATRAVHTADGLYHLVKNNCNTQKPNISTEPYLEMYLSLAGLACEIYMKSIIYNENLHNGKQFRGHKLDKLFQALPAHVKDAIKSIINNIEKILPEIGDLFEKLRYDFECNHIDGEYLLVFKFMEEIKELSHKYPEHKTGSIRFSNGNLYLR